MPESLTIENAGRRQDRVYIGCLVAFWIVWTPLTAFATMMAIRDFNFAWLLWLPFGYAGVLLIPFVLLNGSKPQKLTATSGGLIVEGTGIPFRSRVVIPREDLKELHFGQYDGPGGDPESVPTLNLFMRGSWWRNRIMLAQFAHPSEKRQIFEEIVDFLQRNDLAIKVTDAHE